MSTRRKFIKQVTPLALTPFISWETMFKTLPDLILYNANIITVDANQPRAQALAIYQDRITAIGDDATILKLATAKTKKIDIGGSTITPGFIDAHSHPAYSGMAHLRMIDCSLPSIDAIKSALYQRAKNTKPGDWVLGFKYDDTKTKEGRIITRWDIDEVVPDHPVMIEHRGGHSVYVNSKALELASIVKTSTDPEGGKIGRDSSGELTGQLLENAVNPVRKLIPNTYSRTERAEGVKLITQMMSRSGVTSVTDAYGSAEYLTAYNDAFKAGELRSRIYCMMSYQGIDTMIDAGFQTGFGNEWVRIGGMKATLDGSISERTARLSKPYVGRPNDFGIIVMDEDEIYPYAIKAHKAGWQIGIHANGDVAIDKTLNIYERLQKEYPRNDPRFRIEHCTVINKDLVARMQKLNAIPNPFSTYVYFHGEKMKEYGAERLENMFALRSFLNAGLKATQTSDYPPGPFEPMMAIQSSVTRTDINGNLWGGSQKISVDEAIKIGTLHGAYASFEENEKGSLEEGKLADLVVLAKDPRKEDPLKIVNIPIERTMVGGKWVYES